MHFHANKSIHSDKVVLHQCCTSSISKWIIRKSQAHRNKLIELVFVLELGVAVEEESGMIGIGLAFLVEGLQVVCQVMDPLSI